MLGYYSVAYFQEAVMILISAQHRERAIRSRRLLAVEGFLVSNPHHERKTLLLCVIFVSTFFFFLSLFLAFIAVFIMCLALWRATVRAALFSCSVRMKRVRLFGLFFVVFFPFLVSSLASLTVSK